MDVVSKSWQIGVRVFRQFKAGSTQLIHDGKLRYSLRLEPGKYFTPLELITYTEFPKDLARCLPIFVIFWIPFIGAWISLPLAIMFPRQLLSRQFWSAEQRSSALDFYLDKRKLNYPNALRAFTERSQQLPDPGLAKLCASVCDNVNSNCPLEEDQLADMRKAFRYPQLSLQSVQGAYRKHLADCHAVTPRLLVQRAVYLNNVDRSLNHSGLQSLSRDILDMVAHQRGLPLSNSSPDLLRQRLSIWLSLTQSTEEKELGFLLHLPMFLPNVKVK